MTSRRPSWCTEQQRKKSFGNLILLLCNTWATFCRCFVHQHGRLITWVWARNSIVFAGYLRWIPARDISKLPKYPPLFAARDILEKIVKIFFTVFIPTTHRIHVNYSCNLEPIWPLKGLGKVPAWLLILLFYCPFICTMDYLAAKLINKLKSYFFSYLLACLLACLLTYRLFYEHWEGNQSEKPSFFFSLDLAYTFGCFKDTARRAIAPLEGRSRLLKGNYQRRWDAVRKCALASAKRRYHVFAVQNGGWCASARRAHITFGKYGRSNKCRNGKGGPFANSVYVLRGMYKSESLETLVWFFEPIRASADSKENQSEISTKRVWSVLLAWKQTSFGFACALLVIGWLEM